jgi:hypothetical protein
MGFTKYSNINVRAIQKVTCGELLTEQAMRKKMYTKNKYILK